MVRQVELGHVAGDLAPLDSGDRGINSSETFIGTVDGEFGRKRAYIKVLPSHQLANELVCATVGLEIGLSIPDPYLLEVTPEDLPASRLLREKDALLYAYGSADANHPSLRRKMDGSCELNYALLAGWRDWKKSATFDQWIANRDRHGGNILMESAESMWLIDHDHALTGPRWTAQGLLPEVVVANRVLGCFGKAMSLDKKMEVIQEIQGYIVGLEAVNVSDVLTASRVKAFLSPSDCAAVERFVRDRVRKIHEQMAAALGVPMLSGVNS